MGRRRSLLNRQPQKTSFFYHPGGNGQAELFYLKQTKRRMIDENEYAAFWAERGGRADSFLCLNCGKDVSLDKKRDLLLCTGHQDTLVLEQHLEGKTCPKCKRGVFVKTEIYILS